MKSIGKAALAALTWATLASPAGALDQEAVALGTIAPIPATYRAQIQSWTNFFFPQPQALRSAMLSDPVMIRDPSGRLLWLVCLEAENTAATAGPFGPRRYAFGFNGPYFTAPMSRLGSPLVNTRCDEQPLSWKPFRELVKR